MKERWIFGTLLLLLVGGIAAAIFWKGDDDWNGWRDDRVEVVRVADDGTATTAGTGDTVIIEGNRPFFFPFGLLIFPLLFFLFFGLLRGIFWGGGRGPRGGPGWNGGYNPDALNEWHRRQHEGDRKDADDTSAGTR